jgi:hypothetical protein
MWCRSFWEVPVFCGVRDLCVMRKWMVVNVAGERWSMRSFVHQNPNQAFFCLLAAATGTQKQRQQNNDIIFCLWVLVSLGFCRLMNPSPPPTPSYTLQWQEIWVQNCQGLCRVRSGVCMCRRYVYVWLPQEYTNAGIVGNVLGVWSLMRCLKLHESGFMCVVSIGI